MARTLENHQFRAVDRRVDPPRPFRLRGDVIRADADADVHLDPVQKVHAATAEDHTRSRPCYADAVIGDIACIQRFLCITQAVSFKKPRPNNIGMTLPTMPTARSIGRQS